MKPDINMIPGSLVQIHPISAGNTAFAGCFMVVEEIKQWGVKGYIQGVGTRDNRGEIFPYREEWENIQYIGKAYWVLE